MTASPFQAEPERVNVRAYLFRGKKMGYSIDVYDHDFEQEVLEKSYETPVIVDFFATWCGPCQMLKPMLEKLAQEYDCVVAKVDTDQNPYLAQAFKIEGVPDVKIISQGQVIDGFVGVLPEPELKELLAKCHIKSQVDEDLAAIQAEISADRIEKAQELWDSLLDKYPSNPKVILEAAKFFIAVNQIDRARELLDKITQTEPAFFNAAKAVRALIQFEAECSYPGDDDLDKSFAKAACLTVEGQYEAALQLFLEVLETDRKYKDDGARKAMLSIFDILGGEHPLTLEYRQKLTRALY